MIKPKTRKEVFMDAIAKGKKPAIEPLTSEEVLMAEHAEREATGGGSIPKPIPYDYMPEGYPKKEVGALVYVEEQTIQRSGGPAQINFSNPFFVGDHVDVVWDGTKYETTAFGTSLEPTVGNAKFIGGEDTGEPFFIICVPDGGVMLAFFENETAVVSCVGDAVSAIAEEFLPASVKVGGCVKLFASNSRIYTDPELTKEIESAELLWVGAFESGKLVIVIDMDDEMRTYLITSVYITGRGADALYSGEKVFYTNGYVEQA